ncbi:MAG: HD-GYP domain-containing protein [Blastocatellia bacterium]
MIKAQQAILTFTDAERSLGDRLLKLAVEIDRVEGYSEPHAFAIARLAEKLGAVMGLHGSDLTALKFAALAHDIGERQTNRNYLLRPDALTWEETLDLWRHPILGEQASAELRLSRHAQLLIRWHHEWWNGLGYPDGLAGEAIPLGARILRAIDSYYALISTRPHRERFDALDAEQIVADLAGIEFDPLVVKFLLTILVEERKNREPEIWRAPLPDAIRDAPEEHAIAAVPEAAAVLSAGEFELPSFETPPVSVGSQIESSPSSTPESELEFAMEELLEVSSGPPRSSFDSQRAPVEPLSELLAELPEARPAINLIAVPTLEREVELVELTEDVPDKIRADVSPEEIPTSTGDPAGKDQL